MHKLELKLRRNLSARPTSARETRPQSRANVVIPGLIPPIKDLGDLLMDSKQKDVTHIQLELEKSRTRFFLHAETRRTQQEKDFLKQVRMT